MDSELPKPEVLKPQTDASSAPDPAAAAETANKQGPKRPRRGSYRPSHKGTFIGLIVVIVILAANAAIIAFVLKSQAKNNQDANQGQVTINQDALSKLGVNQTAVGDSGIELTVNPNAKFDRNLQVGGDVSVAGELKLNSKFSAADASLTQLEAGKTSLQQLDVNGDGTLSNLNLRSGLVVAGPSKLQGTTTFGNLVTINNNLNVSGSLSVGGALAISNFSTTNLTIAGHLYTSGLTPTFIKGSGLGGAGTTSVGGNDSAGTINVNTDSSGATGTLINVNFRSAYSRTPHVVVSADNPIPAGVSVYVTRSTSGFSLGVSGRLTGPNTYYFDYIVEQ